MNSTKTPIYFLQDFYQCILERAIAAQTENLEVAKAGTSQAGRDFAQGRALAYYEVIDTFINQAESFGLDSKEIGYSPEDSDKLLRNVR